MNTAATPRDTAHALWQKWTALWNGDLSQAQQILTTDFTVHAALVGDLDEAAVQGARGVAGWVTLLRAALGEPTFTVQIGPIVDGDLVCGRWHVHGHYAGGFPGATATPGTPVAFTGTDVLRVDNGLLAEYWINSDVHVMAAQLGITA
jgi:predicted ester cyclase